MKIRSAKPALRLLLALFVLGGLSATPARGQMLVRSGYYLGDGVNGRAITGLGFQPDVVIVKGNTNQNAVIRTSTMTGNTSKSLFFGTYPLPDRIQSLDADGFTVGNTAPAVPDEENPQLNATGISYYWVAFKASPGELKVGTYTGNDADDRNITGVGFQPDYLLVFAEADHWPWYRFSSMVGDTARTMEGGAVPPGAGANRIQALQPDGFQLGNDLDVNDGSPVTTYHYVAWKSTAGRVATGTYVGNGGASQTISGVGFQPEYVIVSRDTNANVHKAASTGVSTDISQFFGGFPNSPNTPDLVEALQPDGFRVGSANDVNANLITYRWIAFGSGGGGLMRVLSGSYVGDGVDNRSVFVGFKPDVVFVDRDDPAPGANDEAVMRTRTMPAGMSKFVDGGAGIALSANGIKSFVAQGFTVGTNENVNKSGTTYYWVAFTAAPGQLELGTYTGNGGVQNISTVGFSPTYLLAISEGAHNMIQKSSAMPASFSMDFTANGFTNAIQAFIATGFQVGTNSRTNTGGTVHHYAAWAGVPGKVAVGSYIGGAPADDRDITPTGFPPEWVIVSRSSNVAGGQTNSPVHKPASTSVGLDRALLFDGSLAEANNIQKLLADGFQVGGHPRVNDGAAPNNFHWVAFGPHAAQTNFRSIGTRPDYGTTETDGNGTSVTATFGTPFVTGSGASLSWLGFNRGRGDVILIDGVPYTVAAVTSETQLTLTTPYAGVTSGGKAYSIRRQFATLAAWEDCIDGLGNGGSCPYFAPASNSLVADDRSEVGIAYEDSVFTVGVTIDGATTDATHTITLTADGANRHYGLAGQGVVINNAGQFVWPVQVFDDFVTVEWLEIRNGDPNQGAITIENIGVPNAIRVRNNLIHDIDSSAIRVADPDTVAILVNNVVYGVNLDAGIGLQVPSWNAGARIQLFNNTVLRSGFGIYADPATNAQVLLRNNIVHSTLSSPDYTVPGRDPASSHNLSGDATSGTAHSPGGGGQSNIPLTGGGGVNFVSSTPGSENLHLQATSWAVDRAADLSSIFSFDIDGGSRVTPWDIGADDIAATTAVALASFVARPEDGAVSLTWETASELDNLGFHLYRADSPEGRYIRITASPLPGLGSSPSGATYRYRDLGLANGVTYHYKLEDIETTGATTMHGPVSATPSAGAASSGRESSAPLITFGNPSATSLRVLERSRYGLLLELTTGGFEAEPAADGSVALSVPGFESVEGGFPRKRAWVDAIAGRKVKIVSVVEEDVRTFSGLRPSGDLPEVVAMPQGIVRAQRRAREALRQGGLYPPSAAHVLSVGFQGEEKKALFELSPLRWDGAREELRLAGVLVVRVSFAEPDPAERATLGPHGRRDPRRRSHEPRSVMVRFGTSEKGLYRVGFEDVMRGRRSLEARTLRLSRQGEAVAFHLHPQSDRFGPGSVLFFVSGGASLNPYGGEAVYELEAGRPGEPMAELSAAPAGATQVIYRHRDEWEENRLYQAALLDAPDPWLWDLLFAPVKKSYALPVRALASSSTEGATLNVWLQGVSDFPVDPDHHVRVYLNGSLVASSSWNGKDPEAIEVEIAPGLLREGENALELENVGDTAAAYSMVMLDRYAISYPRLARAEEGRLEGAWIQSGTAEVEGLAEGAHLLDVSGGQPRWLVDTERSPLGRIRFRAEAGRSYLAVGPEAVRHPRLIVPTPSRLKDTRHRADYLVLGPSSLLSTAAPLVELRRRQGLTVEAVSIEDVYSEFGFGEPTPVAVRDFLSFAYHRWRKPSVRYVLLLGDATYDFKDHLGTGVGNQVPPLMIKTSYLWTASDPTYAAVNGDDLLPDLAIGRLPAATVEEVRSVVEKILSYEAGTAGLPAGALVLVADNPDRAGNFEADADALASGVLASRRPTKIFLSRLGVAATRNAILESFDDGASLVSYLGHGGIHLWAEENLFHVSDVATLGPAPRQPLVLTMNCLNGYFHFPYFDSLSEELVLAENKGAVAAFSPSGLSVNEPAQVFHRALLEALFGQSHARLGDAVLAAQKTYASTGMLPELLAIYHLIGDPALTLESLASVSR